MPIKRLPQQEQSWSVSYGPDGAGDIERSFNISLTAMPGKISAARRIQPHTTNVIINAARPPSSFVKTNADGTLKYWAFWRTLFKTATTALTGGFGADALTNTPTYTGIDPESADGDLAVFGRTVDRLYDILYATTSTNLSVLNRTYSTTSWISNYWTGTPVTINTATNVFATLIRITTATNHGLSLYDTVLISGCSAPEANGVWRVIVYTPTTFDLEGSTWVGNGNGGTSIKTIDFSSGAIVALAQPALDSIYPSVLQRFSSAQQDLLFVGNGNVVHSIDLQGNVVYNRLVLYADYRCNWIKNTKDRVYVGFKNKNDRTATSYVVEYDPLTETANPVQNYNGETIGFIHDNICHIVDIKGWISRFNSNGFTYVAAFPIAYIDGLRLTAPHRNGVTLLDNRPHILMPSIASSFSFQSFAQIMPAGLWCWEPDSKVVYHKGSIARSQLNQNDFGASHVGSTSVPYGALMAIPSTNIKSQDILAGAGSLYEPQGITSISGIFSTITLGNSPSFNNRGWVVTPKFYSKDINAVYRNIVTQYDPNQYPLGLQAGAFVVKYRTSDPIAQQGTYRSGTWQTETTFDVLKTNIVDMAIGDEIFIIFGMGAGLSVHVSNIVSISGTHSRVTLDEDSQLNPSGNFAFFFENWRKLVDAKYTDGLIDDNTQNTYQMDIPENEASWVQFKIEIRATGSTPFRGMSLEEIGLGYQENLRQEGSQRDNV